LSASLVNTTICIAPLGGKELLGCFTRMFAVSAISMLINECSDESEGFSRDAYYQRN